MPAITLQNIENIKTGDNARRFFRGMKVFMPLLFSEYAMSRNLNTDTEIYKSIRQCLREAYISTDTLMVTLRADEQIKSFIDQFPVSEDLEDWKIFLTGCTWDYREGNNIFNISGVEYVMPELFLHLAGENDKYYAYRYTYDGSDGTCQYEIFNYTDAMPDPVPAEDPFLFKKEKLFKDAAVETVKKLELTDEEFFDLPTISSSDPEQRKAICAGMDKNVVVLAGAGSGKTRTLVSRLVYLHMVKKIPLDRILLLTFSREAADNMKVRGEEIMGPIYECLTDGNNKPNIRARTIDSLMRSIVKDNYQEVGFTREPELRLDSLPQTKEEYKSMVSRVIIDNGMQGIFAKYYYNGRPNDDFKYLLGDLESFACGMPINYAGIERLLRAVIDKQLELHKIYGFVYCNYLVKEAIRDPDSSLYNMILSRYDCILMDEFQDINVLQNETFEPFYSTKMHFTFVGDDDQSIYGWRGSDYSIIKKLVLSPHADTYYLLTNYRNNPNIVQAGNVVLNQIEGRAKKGQPIKPYKKTGPKIRISTYDDKYTNLANEVDRLIKDGYSTEDITILTRLNNDVKTITGALTAADIPVARERIKIDVNDNYKLLKAIICILNEYNLIASCQEIKRICRSEEITDFSVQRMICGIIEPEDSLRKACKLAAELIDSRDGDMSKAVDRYSIKAGELFEKTVNDHHSDPVFDAFVLYTSNNSVPWPASAGQLKELFRTFEDNTRRENRALGRLEKGVKISTIHNAKGLEYSVVMITGLTMGRYPDTSKIDKKYNRRCYQLESLKGSKTMLEDLRQKVHLSAFMDMVRESSNAGADETEISHLREFGEELKLSGQKSIMSLSGQGVADFMESYKCHIDPLKKRYTDAIGKAEKLVLLYKERREILNEEIKLQKQGEAAAEEKQQDLSTINEKFNRMVDAIEQYKWRQFEFNSSISSIDTFYNTCLTASSYLAEITKLDGIVKLKQILEEERKKSINEERRLFYVALTRAKDLLYLCNEAGAPRSEFIEIIPDEFKEEYAILTKEEEKDLRRLKQSLENNLKKKDVNNSLADADTDKLVSRPGFKDIIDRKYSEFLLGNPEYRALPPKAEVYFRRAMGLIFIGEYTGVNFNTEFAHNIQRCTETLLLEISGSDASVLRTTDKNLIKRIATDIHSITLRCQTTPLGYAYIQDLITKGSRYNDELKVLKSAGIFHFIIRSGRYPIPDDVKKTWTSVTQCENSEEFLIAVTDISNTRNLLIHPNEKRWQSDPVRTVLDNLSIVLRNCKKSDKQAKRISKLARDPLYAYRIDRGVRVRHVDFGEGCITAVGKDKFTVTFDTIGEKIFMNSAAEKYFTEGDR